jgi:hypothetical protein
MKNHLLALAWLAGMISAPAQAALSVDLTMPNATFSNTSVFCTSGVPCTFTDTIVFSTPAPYDLMSASISTIAIGGVGSSSDIDFTSVTLDGTAFSLTRLLGGVFEVGGLSRLSFWAPGTHSLTVSGISYGSQGLDGSYSGTLNFAVNTPQFPLPEPSVWLTMVLGFAAIGQALRQRESTNIACSARRFAAEPPICRLRDRNQSFSTAIPRARTSSRKSAIVR